jgi:hypothetical protein
MGAMVSDGKFGNSARVGEQIKATSKKKICIRNRIKDQKFI